MIYRREESSLSAIIYRGTTEEDYPVSWDWVGRIINSLEEVRYSDRAIYEAVESIDDYKYVFTVTETKSMNKDLRYAFDTTTDAIDFVTDFLPLSLDGKQKVIELIIGERTFVYTDHYHNVTIHFKINNPQP